MKNNLLKILGLATLLFARSAFAVTPENGWWWNPAESGRGFNIETQNKTMFITIYVYGQAGDPIWYSGSGQLDAKGILATPLFISKDGQCIGCPYQAPTTTDAGIPVTFHFTSPGEGSILWQGETVPIQRFNFKAGKGVEKLLGEWVLITKEPGNVGDYIGQAPSNEYYGDRVTFNQIMVNGMPVNEIPPDESLSGAKISVLGSRTHKVDDKVTGRRADNLLGFKYVMSMELPEKQHTFEGIGGIERHVGTIRGFAFNFKGLNKIRGQVSEIPASFISIPLLWDEVIHRGREFEGYRVK